MTDKELRKLSREDLLEMLVNQSREVKQLKNEQEKLIKKLRFFNNEFNKVGSLDAIMSKLGVPSYPDSDYSASALEELLRQFEGEETTLEIFEDDVENESDRESEAITGAGDRRSRSGKYRMSSSVKGKEIEIESESIKKSKVDRKSESAYKGLTDTSPISDQLHETDQTEFMETAADIEETDNHLLKEKSPSRKKAKQNRVQEAIAWAKIQFGDKK